MASGRKPDERWALLRKHGKRFSTSDATAIGLSATVLSQAVKRGQIERLGRGAYRFVDDYEPGAVTTRNKRSPRAARKASTPLVSVHLRNFGVFEDATFDLGAGINVLIGENGTGKSHVMQAAYSILRAFHKDDSPRGVAARVEEKLKGVFRPDDRRLGRLVRRSQGGGVAHIRVESGSFPSRSVMRRPSAICPPIRSSTSTRHSTTSICPEGLHDSDRRGSPAVRVRSRVGPCRAVGQDQ